jgi:endonuclease-3
MPRETRTQRAKRALRIVRALAQAYPDARCAPHSTRPSSCSVATILSAQCTDQKVNEVTRVLFRRHGTPQALAAADPEAIEAIVRPTGFYRQKTKSILATAQELVEKHAGAVPKMMEELTALRGVARKTANVVLGTAFGIPGLAVDTHMTRVNQRLRLTESDDPVQIERDLMALVPEAVDVVHAPRDPPRAGLLHGAGAPRCETCRCADCPGPRRASGSEMSRFRLKITEEQVRLPNGRTVELDIVRHPAPRPSCRSSPWTRSC